MAKAMALALGGWFGGLALVTATLEPSRDVVLFGAPEHTLARLTGTDLRIVTITERRLIVRGTAPGFVRALYANGAWLVLPVRGRSCRTPAPNAG
jgi:hypothetical protein